jgi:hypothetical protein
MRNTQAEGLLRLVRTPLAAFETGGEAGQGTRPNFKQDRRVDPHFSAFPTQKGKLHHILPVYLETYVPARSTAVYLLHYFSDEKLSNHDPRPEVKLSFLRKCF